VIATLRRLKDCARRIGQAWQSKSGESRHVKPPAQGHPEDQDDGRLAAASRSRLAHPAQHLHTSHHQEQPMRKASLLALFIASAALLAGCGSISTQFKAASEPAETDARARLRVVAHSLVKAVPGKTCIDWSAPGAGTVFGGMFGSSGYRGRSLDMPSPIGNKRSAGELYVAANQPITLAFVTTPEGIPCGVGRTCHCSVAGSFVPEKDKDYQAVLQLLGNQCSFAVRELDADGTPVTVTPAVPCP
jgi:hypothetical protein